MSAHRAGGIEAALPVIRSGHGKAVMDEVRRLLDAQQEEVQHVLDERSSRADANSHRAIILLVAGTTVSTFLVAFSFVWLRREVADRRTAEANLSRHAETLERTSAELAVARDRAEAADRIKSAFLATMSHELRTPLNSIIGFTGILLQGLAGPLNAEQQAQLGMVQGSARHLLALINDVLDISKIEAGELKVGHTPFDLRAVIDRALAVVRPSADAKGLRLTSRLDPRIAGAVGDARRVEQILLNLLNNAVKFTNHGEVTLTADLAEGECRMQVIDTGIGIAADDLATLFEPFRQIDTGLARNHEGTGLGLAICRRLAHLLGGRIHAASRPGEGSVFSVDLPVNAPVPS